MKKIFSILLAVSVVIGLFAAAAPVMADVEGPVDDQPVVTIPPGQNLDCAGCPTVMNITFNISALVEEGVHEICIDFPDDTYVPPTGADWKDGDINIYSSFGGGAFPCFGSEVTVTNSVYGTQVCAVINTPWDMWPAADNPITIEFTGGAGLLNPTTPGDYTVFVWTTRPQDSTPVESHKYTIKPYYSSYQWLWDSSPTYPGLAPGFVPPFKMSGQNCTGTNMTGCSYCSTIPGFLNAFNITFTYDELGCVAPCDEVALSFHLMSVPAEDCEVTLCINSTCWTLDDADVCTPVEFANINLTANTTISYNASIHFECKGDYELCLLAECELAVCAPPCCPPPELPEECFDLHVYQWKEACKIPLYRKWNLISLPLVPLVDPPIEDVLSAMPDWDKEILSVWYYDRTGCPASGGSWECYSPTGACTGLDTMEDGKAYWVRIDYDPSDPAKQMGAYVGSLWVWGTTKPTPPASPSAYAVCDGWNMVGFTEGCFPLGFGMWDDVYLWNFWPNGGGIPPSLYGAVYGWDATTQTWDWPFAPFSVWMLPGKGYWISFNGAGVVYPP